MRATLAACLQLQLDCFYSDPAVVAKMFMATGSKTILREAKKRGIDLAPHLQNEFERQTRTWELLKRDEHTNRKP